MSSRLENPCPVSACRQSPPVQANRDCPESCGPTPRETYPGNLDRSSGQSRARAIAGIFGRIRSDKGQRICDVREISSNILDVILERPLHYKEVLREIYRNTDHRTKKISEMVGFTDWRYLAKLCRSHAGRSLSALRRNTTEGKNIAVRRAADE